MRVLVLMRLMSGFVHSFETGVWQPMGSPAASKLIEALDQSKIESRFIFSAKSRATHIRSQSPSGLKSKAAVLNYHWLSNCCGRKAGRYINELHHLLRVLFNMVYFKPDVIYADRSNVLIASCIARLTKTPIVLRVLGVTPSMWDIISNERSFYCRLYKWAYRAKYALVIGSMDGSSISQWLSQSLHPRTPLTVLLNGIDELAHHQLVHAGVNSDRVLRDDFDPDQSEPQRAYSKEYVSEDSRRAGAKASGKHGQNLAPCLPETILFGYGLGFMLAGMGAVTFLLSVAPTNHIRFFLPQSWGFMPAPPDEGAVSRGIILDHGVPYWIRRLTQSVNFYRHDALIWEAAADNGLDPNLWKAVVMVESAGDPEATSHVGAMGLAQMMPTTARDMGLESHQYYDPRSNLDAGAKYLGWLIKRFGGNLSLALSAYNAGPAVVDRRQASSYRETRKFVDYVLTLHRWIQKNPSTWAMVPVRSMAGEVEVPVVFPEVGLRMASL